MSRAALSHPMLIAMAASALLLAASSAAQSRPSPGRTLIASKTEQFKEKEGFERHRKDIINTLKDNDVTRFQTLLDGLTQAFDLDKTLKGKGPYTLFAPSDKAFKKLPDDDRQSLWANKKKLKQVLQYEIVPKMLSSKDLRSMQAVKTLEGHSCAVSTQGNDLYIDKALVTVTDIPCSNGVIHVLDDVIMPPLGK